MKFPKISKRKTLALALLPIFFFLCYTFPFLLYPIGNPYTKIKDQNPIFLENRALFIADIHFTGESMDFGTYLQSNAIDDLIIIGDLYDSPRDYYDLGIHTTLQRLNLDTYPGRIYFIWGTSRHDPHVNISTPNFQTLGNFGLFATAQYTILAYHGYHRANFGPVALLFDYFISYPLLQQLWRNRAGVPEDVWVFSAHSHIAKIDPNLKIANCGGFADISLLHPPLGEGILVDEQIQLVTIPF